MINLSTKLSATVLLLLLFMACTNNTATRSMATLTEVVLSNELDEPRGYCLDIAGGKGANAKADRGLQAHTCYHYTGTILEDQGFDSALIEEGRFRIPYYDKCMSVASVAADTPISLEQCLDVDTQEFMLQSNGQLVTKADPSLCVTTSETEKREGRGGSPVHVMRPLSLQPCDDSRESYQRWTLKSL